MANTRSALKNIRKSLKRRLRNKSAKSAMKTWIKKARLAIQTDPTTAWEKVKKAISVIDKTAERGIIHKNNAARRKSRLMHLYNKALAERQGVSTTA